MDSMLDYTGLKKLVNNIDLIYTESEVFSLTLQRVWLNYKLTITDSRFDSDDIYVYLIYPVKDSRKEYTKCKVCPDDKVIIDGMLEFSCEIEPTSDLNITVLKIRTKGAD